MPLEFVVFPWWQWKKPYHLQQKQDVYASSDTHSSWRWVCCFYRQGGLWCFLSLALMGITCVSFPSSTVRSDSFSCSLLYLWDSIVSYFSFLPCIREFVPLNFHLSLSNRILHSVSKLGALCTSDNNFWCAKGGICISQQDWCFGVFLLGSFFHLFCNYKLSYDKGYYHAARYHGLCHQPGITSNRSR